MTYEEVVNHVGPVKLPYWLNEKYLFSPPTIRKIQVRTDSEGQKVTAVVSWTFEIPPKHQSMAATINREEEVFDVADLEPA